MVVALSKRLAYGIFQAAKLTVMAHRNGGRTWNRAPITERITIANMEMMKLEVEVRVSSLVMDIVVVWGFTVILTNSRRYPPTQLASWWLKVLKEC